MGKHLQNTENYSTLLNKVVLSTGRTLGWTFIKCWKLFKLYAKPCAKNIISIIWRFKRLIYLFNFPCHGVQNNCLWSRKTITLSLDGRILRFKFINLELDWETRVTVGKIYFVTILCDKSFLGRISKDEIHSNVALKFTKQQKRTPSFLQVSTCIVSNLIFVLQNVGTKFFKSKTVQNTWVAYLGMYFSGPNASLVVLVIKLEPNNVLVY